MTTAAPARAPTPRLKSTATSATTAQSVTASNSNPNHPRPAAVSSTAGGTALPAQTAAPRRAARTPSIDPLSDKATILLIRRVLCSQQLSHDERAAQAPIEELLPPLTSRNDVDLQLYAIIAIVIREFVQKWYNNITPDENFVAEIVQIIAHCSRALEQRLRKVDLEGLLFDELPELLDRHVQAYRVAHQPLISPPIDRSPREIYHSLCPLPLASPVPRPQDPQTVVEQEANEVAYRQLLVQGVLAVLLPTEDLENDCLTSLVGQIFSELIIGGVIAKKASEPWMILEGLAILARVIRQKVSAVDESQAGGRVGSKSHDDARGMLVQRLFWSMIRWAFAAFAFVRFLFVSIAMARSLPSRRQYVSLAKQMPRYDDTQEALDPHGTASSPEPIMRPVLAFGVWAAVSNLIELDGRMPWLNGALSMLQWAAMMGPGQVARQDGILDRQLSYLIHRHILDPAQLPPLLRTLRGALFPNNAMGTPTLVAPSSEAELRALRRKSARALWELVPRRVGRLYFGGALSGFTPRSGPSTSGGGGGGGHQGQASSPAQASEADDHRPRPPQDRRDNATTTSAATHGDDSDDRILDDIERDVLDPFSDAYCNKHLMYSVLELVLVRLMPELAERRVTELWEERLS